jgi:hypothetical protein
MRLDLLLFGLLLAMATVLGVAVSIPPADNATGVKHPVYEDTMLRGGPAQRHERILVVGWLFGLIQIAVYASCLALAVGKPGSRWRVRLALGVGFLLYAGVFSAMMLTYRESMGHPSPRLVLSFPPATAWLVYGLWVVPVFFVVLFVAGFRRWYVTEEDEERFKQLVQAIRSQQAQPHEEGGN